MLEDHSASDKIAVINVEGIISGGMGDLDMVRLIREQLKRAKEDKRVKAVVLRIDSPGGEVLAAESIYADIKQFQEDSKKPVVACMGSMAASGGYYVAAPCRWIVAHELTITGSIGVIMHGYNYRGLMNKVGLRPEVFKSGKFKDMLSGDKDVENMTAEEREVYLEERAMVQALINEAFDTFKDRIKSGRAKAAELNRAANLRNNWADYADGRVLSGRQALQHGFVDQNGAFEDAVKYAAKLTGLPKANLVTYGIPFDFSNILRLLGKSEPPSLKVDWGVNLPQLKTGRLYYLSPVLPY
jgi:protease-4